LFAIIIEAVFNAPSNWESRIPIEALVVSGTLGNIENRNPNWEYFGNGAIRCYKGKSLKLSKTLQWSIIKKLGDKPRYVFSNFDAINNSVKSSKKYIGFAFPLESGLFEVNRFLLDGAPEAIVRMKVLSNSKKKKSGGGGTSSYKL
jgi:hypothetical protein